MIFKRLPSKQIAQFVLEGESRPYWSESTDYWKRENPWFFREGKFSCNERCWEKNEMGFVKKANALQRIRDETDNEIKTLQKISVSLEEKRSKM